MICVSLSFRQVTRMMSRFAAGLVEHVEDAAADLGAALLDLAGLRDLLGRGQLGAPADGDLALVVAAAARLLLLVLRDG
ncbi:MAG: hypothetical protein M5U28_56730 [Sandaracinaceae bacterium]|nr:hypothetical protein [Sandaracinaceae bacterium]